MPSAIWVTEDRPGTCCGVATQHLVGSHAVADDGADLTGEPVRVIEGDAGSGEEQHDSEADHAEVQVEEPRPAGDDAAQVSVARDRFSAYGSQSLLLRVRCRQGE